MKKNRELERRADLWAQATERGLWDMPMKQLRALRKAAASRTSTNCWWAEFRLAPALLRSIDQAIKDRTGMRRAGRDTSEHI